MPDTLKRKNLIDILGITDPFLMIDSVELNFVKNTAVGTKNISDDAWFYQCHFVDEPVMPGVLLTEVMLQTFTAAVCKKFQIQARECLVNKVSVNFFKKVTGKGSLSSSVNLNPELQGLITGKSEIVFNGAKVCNASFRFLLPTKWDM